MRHPWYEDDYEHLMANRRIPIQTRNRHECALTFGSFAFLVIAGCSTASSAVPPPTTASTPVLAAPRAPLFVAAPYIPAGEQLTWQMSLHGIVGGTATLAYGQPGQLEGRNAIVMRSHVQSLGVANLVKKVRDDITTWVDASTSLPIRTRGIYEIGNKHMVVETNFQPGTFQIEYQKQNGPMRSKTQEMPHSQTAYDAHAALGLLRAWNAPVGTRAYFYTLGGRLLSRNEVRIAGKEKLRTKFGTLLATRIEGRAIRYTAHFSVKKGSKPRMYTIWISADARRLPLRVDAQTEFGKVTVELTEFH